MNKDSAALARVVGKKNGYVYLQYYMSTIYTHFLCEIPRTSQKGIRRCLLEVALFLLGTAIIYMMLSFEPAFAEQD
jgi:hypothetical protein